MSTTPASVLVTGVSGLVGRAVERRLGFLGCPVMGAARHGHRLSSGSEAFTAALLPDQNWSAVLVDCRAVIHLAARVHVMRDTAGDPLSAFREVNTAGTLNLARQAAAPQDPYGISKREAEDGLRAIAAQTGMDVVIMRPPLVYGPGVKANFATLMRAVQRGLPLPLASVTHNRRSLVALDNLVDLLITCLDHPAAANQTFLVSDGEDLSTADLLRRLGRAMNKPARLFPVPVPLLRAGAALLGKRDVAQRLLGNLQVDITHTRETLGWTPPISVDEGLRRAVAGLREP
jgi:nucleoside-diphosphate-sugar epimerase